ncbi:MAG: bifunctional biotin--[acetyl-CoA-carboxylase] ligase/biotin operon repressor BirA [Pseudomonadota bacterium]|nr:bifunctional biotin--[acetyl-CoA-carboxylase] ligase/biotin operon repressor BirA [Pseudomonadota bacterium]
METHLQIVRQLADGEFHSGEKLAERFGISRAAVWKAVHKAGEVLGLEVESRRGCGYRLTAPLELLDPQVILAGISHEAQRHIARLEIHDNIDSTNSHLMREAHAGAPTGTLCLAERQTAGRGRRGRTWVSPFGSNVYLSVLWRYPFGPAELGGLSLASGTAIAGALQAQGVEGIALKWPNDVLWQRRKLAGLLLEVAGEAHGPSLVVVGLGLNTRLRGLRAAEIDQPWVDLDTVLGPDGYGRNRLAAQVAERLIGALERYGREGLTPFLEEWERFDLYRGERVEVRLGDRRIVGIHAGITEQGALRLDVGGTLQAFQAGEVSLRPADNH